MSGNLIETTEDDAETAVAAGLAKHTRHEDCEHAVLINDENYWYVQAVADSYDGETVDLSVVAVDLDLA
jgi:hypothetical protein